MFEFSARLCSGATSNHAGRVIGCKPSGDLTTTEVQCRRKKPIQTEKSDGSLTGSGYVCGRGHISVSANKLSPRPDVSKTAWVLESVGSKNKTLRTSRHSSARFL